MGTNDSEEQMLVKLLQFAQSELLQAVRNRAGAAPCWWWRCRFHADGTLSATTASSHPALTPLCCFSVFTLFEQLLEVEFMHSCALGHATRAMQHCVKPVAASIKINRPAQLHGLAPKKSRVSPHTFGRMNLL